MKKLFVVILIIIITFFIGDAYVVSKKNNTKVEINEIKELKELKGIYISYLEYLTYFQGNSNTINKSCILKMLDNIKEMKFNSIFLHVSPFSDSIYYSSIFPATYTISGYEGKNLGMDYLKYFIDEAHKRGIKVHAWVNPYRISSTNDLSKISDNNVALEYIKSGDAKIGNNGIYYNPASPKVLELLLKQIYEIILNYDVDGIHLDDYFYEDNEIDIENYNKYFLNENITLDEYRLNIINTTIKSIYKLIKNYNSNIIFSISPDGNIDNNYNYHFADIKKWLLETDYVDIIMPQVYYGFDNEFKPFKETIDEWNSLIKNNVKIVPVLAFYKVGRIDSLAGNGKYEWINNSNIILREINYSKTLSNYYGYSLFRYEYMFNDELINSNTKEEVKNILN